MTLFITGKPVDIVVIVVVVSVSVAVSIANVVVSGAVVEDCKQMSVLVVVFLLAK